MKHHENERLCFLMGSALSCLFGYERARKLGVDPGSGLSRDT